MSRKLRNYALLIMVSCAGIWACKPSKAPADLTSKVIRSIGRSTIQFEDGSTYKLPQDSTVKIAYLIRHAEKDSLPANNPALSIAGQRRAAKLRHLLGGTRIDEIYATMYQRTIMTVADIAAAKGMNILPYKPAAMRQLAHDIRQGPGQHVLIVGHSNTTKSMANVLLNENRFTDGIPEDQYDNFYIVILHGDDQQVLELKY